MTIFNRFLRAFGRPVIEPGKSGFLSWSKGCAGGALVLALLVQVAVPAVRAQSSQHDVPPTSQAQTSCELHVWPSAMTHTTYTGWFHGGAVDGKQRGMKGYPEMYADALDTPQQVRLLSQIDWRTQTGDPNLHFVVHQSPTGSDEDRKRTSRLVADAGPCYRELIITSSIVEAEALSSQSVRVVALRKKFDGAGAPPVNFATMSMAVVQIPDKAGADYDGRMRTAVQSAFLAAVNKFVIMQSFH